MAPRGTSRRARRALRFTAATIASLTAAATLAACGTSSGSDASGSAGSGDGNLKPLVIGLPAASISPSSTNYAIGETMGCYKRYGYHMSISVVTNPAQQLAAFNRGAISIGTGGSDQYLSILDTMKKSSGSDISLKAFYEVDYPFKYGLAVPKDSPITSLSQLEGKTVGVDALSNSSKITLQALLSENGLNPNGVTVIATGQGAASGQALQSGRVQALFSSDTVYGTILQAGVPLRFVTVNGKQPYLNVSGVVAYATKTADPKAVAAFARCSTEGSIFAAENPAAAAYIMLHQYPALGKTGAPLSEQITNLALPIMLRTKLFANPDTSAKTPYGLMNEDEFQENQKILKSPAMDTSSIFDNSQVPVLTAAEVAAVKKQADTYAIPGISGKVALPTIPADAP
ncbi:ABC transporter substrate-binding protein [Amycolatopsis sp. NPDC001319]|uniref:ABC transporter substrate-binding protein n=1 Tax=unclassified Amycolatopsis TaxID=2618356 RepID=UPI00369D3D80